MLRKRLFPTLAVFLFGLFHITETSHFTLDIECQPNGDIIVQNPEISTFKSATAGTESVIAICNVTSPDDCRSFIISGCPKNEDILFTLSVREGADAIGDGIVSGSYSETYVLRCEEIDDTGVLFNTSTKLNVGTGLTSNETQNETGEYVGAPVTPSFAVISSIWNSDVTQTVTEASVGDLLKWKVDGPYEYDLLPYHCTVNPGKVVGTPPVVPVILEGCSALDMVTNFVASSGTASEKGSLVSDIYAFKFHSSDDLTIACSVRICTRGDVLCNVDCSSRRRRDLSVRSTDLAGTRATVVSHLTIRSTGATISGLSNILTIAVCITTLVQSRLYQWT